MSEKRSHKNHGLGKIKALVKLLFFFPLRDIPSLPSKGLARGVIRRRNRLDSFLLVWFTQSLMPLANTGYAAAMGKEPQYGWSDRPAFLGGRRGRFRPFFSTVDLAETWLLNFRPLPQWFASTVPEQRFTSHEDVSILMAGCSRL